MTILGELAGLHAAFTAAVDGAITRPVTVRSFDLDGLYEGTYPYIIIRPAYLVQVRLAGGRTGVKGQQGNNQNLYTFEIRDVIDQRQTPGERTMAAQIDVYTLYDAIKAAFDHLPTQLLPVDDVAQAEKAGDTIRSRVARPWAEGDAGEITVLLAGAISVIGIPVEQSET